MGRTTATDEVVVQPDILDVVNLKHPPTNKFVNHHDLGGWKSKFSRFTAEASASISKSMPSAVYRSRSSWEFNTCHWLTRKVESATCPVIPPF
jgi:hypothetical protein